MKKILILICYIIATMAAKAQAPTFQWAKGMGGNSYAGGNSIAVDGAGNVYTTGLFHDTVDFDPGPGTYNLVSKGGYDIFISKLDAAGNFIWGKSIGDTLDDNGNAIVLDASGNVYITGAFQGTADFNPGAGVANLTAVNGNNIFVLKLDTSGNFVLAKNMGGTIDAIGKSIAVDGIGNIYTTGSFQGTADFDPGAGIVNLTAAGGNDLFISKLNSSGNFVWAKSMGDTLDDVGYSIALDATGNVYTTGGFAGTIDFDPGAGVVNLTTDSSTYNMFILKLDTSGNYVWAKNAGGALSTNFITGYSIAVDVTDNVYTTGNFYGTVDSDPGAGVFNLNGYGAFVLKLDASGNLVWAKSLNGTINSASSIAIDQSNNVYTIGTFYGTVDFDPGPGTYNLTFGSGGIDNAAYISKLDASGNFAWAVNMVGYSYGESIAVDASNYVYTTGTFVWTTDFDPGAGTFNLTPSGINTIFVHKMGQTSMGISEYWDNNNISIYPNPANEMVTINVNEINNFENTNIMLFDYSGKLILKEKIVSTQTQMNIANLSTGLYFVQLQSGNKIFSKKFIKA